MCDTMVNNNIKISIYCIVNNNKKNKAKSKPSETLKSQRFKAVLRVFVYFRGTNIIIPLSVKLAVNV